MSNTTYVDYTTPTINAAWLNEINDHVWHDTPVVSTTVHNAINIQNTPAGNITSTNIQTALNELDTLKAPNTFTQSGTGAVTRTLTSKLKDTISVLDFGAIGDWNGTTGTDNSTAIQNAINYLFSIGGGTLLFPKGFYKITQTLNLTGDGTTGRYGNTPIVFQGAGMPNAFDTGSWTTYGGSFIVGQTNGWMVDCTGLQYFNMFDMGLRGTGTNASKGGILFARSTFVTFAQNCTLRRNTIWIDTSPAYTTAGSIGVANNGAESFNMEQNWIIADTPVACIFNSTTDLNLVSSYVTIATSPLSSTNIEARGNTFQALTKYALHLQGIGASNFDNNVYACNSTNTTNYAIRLLAGGSGGTAHCQDIKLSGQIEAQGTGFGGAVRFDDSQTWNIDINLMHNNPSQPYISCGGVTMNGNNINVHHQNGSTGQYVLTCSSTSSYNGGNITIYDGDTGISANTNLTTNGTALHGNGLSLAGNLGLSTTSSYLANSIGGVSVVNARGNTGSIANATPVTIFTLPSNIAGQYKVVARLPAGVGTPAIYVSSTDVFWDGTAARTTTNNGTNLPITVVGSNIQVAQSSGGVQAAGINWSIVVQYLA